MNHDAWECLRAIAPDLSAYRPFVGRTVRVMSGKNCGAVGRVNWHGRDRFSQAFRYGDAMSNHCTEIAGRYGYRVGIALDDKTVFVPADNVMVCVEAQA